MIADTTEMNHLKIGQTHDYTKFTKSRKHSKILNVRMVTRIKFQNDGRQILGTTLKNLIGWRPGERKFCTPVSAYLLKKSLTIDRMF